MWVSTSSFNHERDFYTPKSRRKSVEQRKSLIVFRFFIEKIVRPSTGLKELAQTKKTSSFYHHMQASVRYNGSTTSKTFIIARGVKQG